MIINGVVSPFSEDHFSNNDFLEVRVGKIGNQGYTKGEVTKRRKEVEFKASFHGTDKTSTLQYPKSKF